MHALCSHYILIRKEQMICREYLITLIITDLYTLSKTSNYYIYIILLGIVSGIFVKSQLFYLVEKKQLLKFCSVMTIAK